MVEVSADPRQRALAPFVHLSARPLHSIQDLADCMAHDAGYSVSIC